MIEIDGRPVRLSVATPTRDARLHVAHAECVRAMEIRCRASGIEFARAHVYGYAIDRMRDDLVSVAMQWEATHLLMIDDDIALPQENAIDLLLSAMASTKADVVAAVCVSKPPSIDHTGKPSREPPFASQLLDAEGRRHTIDVAASHGQTIRPPEGMALLAGCGVMLIDTRAFGRFDAPRFRFADGLSEDWWFSREVQRLGGTAVLEPRVATTHYGVTGWTWTPSQ